MRHTLTGGIRDPEDWKVDDHLLAERVEDEEVVIVQPLGVRGRDREVPLASVAWAGPVNLYAWVPPGSLDV